MSAKNETTNPYSNNSKVFNARSLAQRINFSRQISYLLNYFFKKKLLGWIRSARLENENAALEDSEFSFESNPQETPPIVEVDTNQNFDPFEIELNNIISTYHNNLTVLNTQIINQIQQMINDKQLKPETGAALQKAFDSATNPEKVIDHVKQLHVNAESKQPLDIKDIHELFHDDINTHHHNACEAHDCGDHEAFAQHASKYAVSRLTAEALTGEAKRLHPQQSSRQTEFLNHLHQAKLGNDNNCFVASKVDQISECTARFLKDLIARRPALSTQNLNGYSKLFTACQENETTQQQATAPRYNLCR